MTEKILSTPIASSDLAELRAGDIVYLSGLLVTGRDDVYHRVVRQGLSLPADLSGLAVFHAGPIMRGVAGVSGCAFRGTSGNGVCETNSTQANTRNPWRAAQITRGVAGYMADSCYPAERGSARHEGGAREGRDFSPINHWEVISIGPTTSMRMESCQAEFLEASGAKLIVGKGGMGPATADACRRLQAVHTVFPGGCAVLAAARVEAVEAAHWLDLGMSEAMWVLRVNGFGPLIVSIDTLGNNLFAENRRLFEDRKKAALETLRPRLRFME